MTYAERLASYDVVWDGSHQERDADLLCREVGIPEKIRLPVPDRTALLMRPSVVERVGRFLRAQAPDRWWTVAEIAAPLRQHRESVRSALRILGPSVDRRALDGHLVRDPRWAFRWRRQ